MSELSDCCNTNDSRAESHPASIDLGRLSRQCDIQFLRRSGPGGQHRNKVETGVRLIHRPSGLRAEATERRVQSENQRVALRRLRLRLALQWRENWHQPSAVWRKHAAGGKMKISPRHNDFPAVLAEALDALQSMDWDHRQAAGRLNVSATQLSRLLQREPRAWEQLNQRRVQHGLHRLKP